MPADAPRPLSGVALAAFLLALLSLLLQALAAVPALVLGLRGLREVNRSEGRLGGGRLAVAALVLGGLVVVLDVLGLVFLILLKLHEDSSRADCADHLRRLGAAVNVYQEQNKTFPPGTIPNRAVKDPEKRLSWLAAVLPYLEDASEKKRWSGLADGLDRKAAWDAPANAAAAHTNVPAFLCPSHPTHDPQARPGWTHYVGFGGDDAPQADGSVLPAAELPLESPWIGVFGYDRLLKPEDVKAGLGLVWAATETARDNGPWIAGGPATVRGVDPRESDYIGVGRPFGGFHAGGLNVLKLDGSAEFVRDGIQPELFRLMPLVRREEPAAER
jgi:prepilin-type processing-associated H-X9-DG protein